MRLTVTDVEVEYAWTFGGDMVPASAEVTARSIDPEVKVVRRYSWAECPPQVGDEILFTMESLVKP